MSDTVPPWLQTMRDITGTKEVQGAANSPVIMAWRDEIARRYPDMAEYCAGYTHDSIAWCGLTVAYCMARNGIKPVKEFLWADNWRKFGTKLDKPRLGCILTFKRTGGNHVALYEGEEGSNYIIRGGNQSDMVCVQRKAKSELTGIVWPSQAATISIKPSAPLPPIALNRCQSITATMFDDRIGAYGPIDHSKPGVALPAAFSDPRPKVRVFYQGKSVVCDIVDKGPWNIRDPYWQKVGGRPQAETGKDLSGRQTNLAGIDLTPAAAKAIGLPGKGKVDWEFVGAATAPTPSKPKEPAKEAAKQGIFAAIAATLALVGSWLMEHWIIAIVATAALVAAVWFGWRWWRERQKNAPAANVEANESYIEGYRPGELEGLAAVRQALAEKPKPAPRRKPKGRVLKKVNRRKPAKRRA